MLKLYTAHFREDDISWKKGLLQQLLNPGYFNRFILFSYDLVEECSFAIFFTLISGSLRKKLDSLYVSHKIDVIW